jgi:hypothetical protein
MAHRFIIRVELTATSKRMLSVISDRNGMTQVAVMSRLVEWFNGQPDAVQAAVLGRYPEDFEADIAKLILRRMAGQA